MHAVVVDELGGPESLRLKERPEPTPGPGQVSIDVAAGVNLADAHARASGYLVRSLPFVPGLEASGHVREVGEGVTDLTVGEPVTALTIDGAYAEVVLASAALTFAVPDGLDLRRAATLPIVLPTAYALIHDVGRLHQGESLLVHSAAGGVGTVVGQVARLANAGAIFGVVSRPEKAQYARQFDYDEVFLADDFDVRARAATNGRAWTSRSTRPAARPGDAASTSSRRLGGWSRSVTPPASGPGRRSSVPYGRCRPVFTASASACSLPPRRRSCAKSPIEPSDSQGRSSCRSPATTSSGRSPTLTGSSRAVRAPARSYCDPMAQPPDVTPHRAAA